MEPLATTTSIVDATSDQPIINHPATVAPAPFNRATADTVLVSSDGVEFMVWRVILREASQFFDTMFDIPQPEAHEDAPSSRSYIPVTEDSRTLDILLRFCYPLENPEMENLDDIKKVLEAARKYSMDAMFKVVGRTLLQFLKTEPLRMWAIACHFELLDHAQAAARELLGTQLEGQFVQELAEVTAGAYHRLLQYCANGGMFTFQIAIHPGPGGTAEGKIMSEEENRGLQSIQLAKLNPAFTYQSMPDADLIVRSSGRTEFYAHRAILIIASPVLKHELAASSSAMERTLMPRWPGDREPGLPVFDMAESERILESILRLCYPIVQPNWESHTLADLKALLAAVLKYQMTTAVDVVKKMLLSRAPKDTASVYFIFDHYSCKEEALAVAKLILQNPIAGLYSSELETIPATSLFKLITYHQTCGKATTIPSSYHGMYWVTALGSPSFQSCSSCGYVEFGPSDLRKWLAAHVNAVLDALKLRPSSSTVLDPLLVDKALTQAAGCFRCRSDAASMLRAFNLLLARRVDEIVNSQAVELFGELKTSV